MKIHVFSSTSGSCGVAEGRTRTASEGRDRIARVATDRARIAGDVECDDDPARMKQPERDALEKCRRQGDLLMFDRIVSTPAILGGKPIVRGTRISVEFILELIASGGSIADIVRDYPFLAEEDVRQAVRFAAESLKIDIDVTAGVA